MRIRYVILLIIICLLLDSCLDTTPITIEWSSIQDQPVPRWLESWALSKASSIDSKRSIELALELVWLNDISTPELAVAFLRKNFSYIQEFGDKWFDLADFIERGGGDCEDWAIALARLWQALSLESYVVVHFNSTLIYAHAFAVHVEQEHLRCATPYAYVQRSFEKLRDAVRYMDELYEYGPGPYIAIPITHIGNGAGGSEIGAE